MTVANILSIAGSDPSGGAGIQADLKAISANGAYAMAALTALTAQNTQGVSGVHLVPPAFVRQQIDQVFADVRVDAVKIGMIATAEIAAAVAESLAAQTAPAVVLDPVMISKSGHRLLDESAIDTLRDRLVPLARVITPNLPEAQVMLGWKDEITEPRMVEAATALLDLGAGAVLLKGGHLSGEASPDLLLQRDQAPLWVNGPRIDTKNTHGTGCTLSSALAALIPQSGTLAEAVKRAKAYVAAAIASSGRLTVGHGHGPVDHFHARHN